MSIRLRWPGAVSAWVLGVAVAALGLYAFVPDLRLALHHSTIAHIGSVREVDPHIYDAEWFDAARAGRVDILQALHDAHYPVDARTKAGYTALILAAYDERPEALSYLLDIGADACAADKNGNTALMGALYKGETHIASKLLDSPCPIDQANNAGETALGFAVLFGRVEMIPVLVAHGADPGHRDAKGQTAFAVAKAQGNGAAMAALMDARRSSPHMPDASLCERAFEEHCEAHAPADAAVAGRP